jgi:hypothetical protein
MVVRGGVQFSSAPMVGMWESGGAAKSGERTDVGEERRVEKHVTG